MNLKPSGSLTPELIQRVERLLDLWEEAKERGEPFSPTDHCRDSPQVLEEVLRKIAAIEKIEGRLSVTQPLHPTTAAVLEPTQRSAIELMVQSHDLELHATGGLGAVYSCRDAAINRKLAVKFVRKGVSNEREAIERLLIEARITGALDHPGVVPVHGIGKSADNEPFYVMRFVKGQTLAEAIEQFYGAVENTKRYFDTLEFRNLLTRFVSVCRTVAFAHGHGVLHRDLKPQNILLGRFGETLVADWGLACYLPEQADADAEGSHVVVDTQFRNAAPSGLTEGTPAYMSPEQHMGCSLLTTESDVYALGVILFKIITGQLPCNAESSIELRERVIQGQITMPREVRKECPQGLAKICETAMQLEIEDRYSSPEQIANDIEAYLGGYASSVYREPIWLRLFRYGVTHRFTAYSLIFLGAMMALISAALPIFALSNLENERRFSQLDQRLDDEALKHLDHTAKVTAQQISLQIESHWLRLMQTSQNAQVQAMGTRMISQPESELQKQWESIQAERDVREALNALPLQSADLFFIGRIAGASQQDCRLLWSSSPNRQNSQSQPLRDGLTSLIRGKNDLGSGPTAHLLLDPSPANGIAPTASLLTLVPTDSNPSQLQVLGLYLRRIEERLLPSSKDLLQGREPAVMMLIELPTSKRSCRGLFFDAYQPPDRKQEDRVPAATWRAFELTTTESLWQQLHQEHLAWQQGTDDSTPPYFDLRTSGEFPLASLGQPQETWSARVYPISARTPEAGELDTGLAIVLLWQSPGQLR